MNRLVSRVISIFDISVSPFAFVALVYIATLLMLNEHEISKDYQEEKELAKIWTVILTVCWILLAFGLLSSVLQGFGGYKLLSATKKDGEPEKCVHMCRLWQGITIFSIVVNGVATLLLLFGPSAYVYISVVYIFLRLLSLAFVQRHVSDLKELKKELDNPVRSTYNLNENKIDPNLRDAEWSKA